MVPTIRLRRADEAVSTVQQRRGAGMIVTHAPMDSRFLAKKIPAIDWKEPFARAIFPRAATKSLRFVADRDFGKKNSCPGESSLDLPDADNHVRGMPFRSGDEDRTREPLQLGRRGFEHWGRSEIDKGWMTEVRRQKTECWN
jgi:hypothetical protein